MKDRKYSSDLFLTGFLMNLLLRRFYLFVPSLILSLIGIWSKACLYIGLALLALDIVICLVEQLLYKRTVEANEDPDFQPFADAMQSDNWQEKVFDLVEDAMEGQEKGEEDSSDTDDFSDTDDSSKE